MAPTGVFDGDGRIHARRLVEIHVVRAEPLQRVGESALDGVGVGVHGEEGAVRRPARPELHGDEGALAPAAPERFAQEQLVVSHAVEVAGIEHRDTRVERGLDRGDALHIVAPSVAPRHGHASQSERGDLRPGPAQLPLLHASPP